MKKQKFFEIKQLSTSEEISQNNSNRKTIDDIAIIFRMMYLDYFFLFLGINGPSMQN